MQKRCIVQIVGLILICAMLAACAASPALQESGTAELSTAGAAETASVSPSSTVTEELQSVNLMPRALVAYCSFTGRTKLAAEAIADATGGELFQIEPAEPYTKADLDYNNSESRSSLEIAGSAALPEIASQPQDIRQYNVVYLGYPIWWNDAPPIIRAFLDDNAAALAGMKVVPFCTSGSSGIEHSAEQLRAEYPDIDWQQGERIADPSGELHMSEWSDELGFWPFGE